jgi:hypothetical protein
MNANVQQPADPGWSDEDLRSILKKLQGREIFKVSEREMKAHIAYMKECGEKSVFAA